jgi:tRNA threonylcarbamoyl adenosine modification protein YeaZ
VLVLALDTSTPSVTAGVVRLRRPHEIIAALDSVGGLGDADSAATAARPGTLLAEHRIDDAFAHAERLMPLARAALSDAGCTLRDLDAVVVGLGPGPFTGLRVGVATAAALGDALGAPVHGVPSHDATARSVAPWVGDLIVVTDARRREVYLSAYRQDGSRALGPLVAAPVTVPELLTAERVEPARVVGSGAGLLNGFLDIGAPSVTDAAGPADPSPGSSLALGLVERAAVALLTGAVPGPLTPLYLRRPDATEPGARKSVLGR